MTYALTTSLGNHDASGLVHDGYMGGLGAGQSYTSFTEVERFEVHGGTRADLIVTGNGADTLIGGAGTDSLDGGGGADIFRYASASEGRDQLSGFESGLDRLEVSASGFGGGLVADVALAAERFASNLTGRATSADGIGQFIFETDTARLWWDADGNGAGIGVILVQLTAGAAMLAADIAVIA